MSRNKEEYKQLREAIEEDFRVKLVSVTGEEHQSEAPLAGECPLTADIQETVAHWENDPATKKALYTTHCLRCGRCAEIFTKALGEENQ